MEEPATEQQKRDIKEQMGGITDDLTDQRIQDSVEDTGKPKAEKPVSELAGKKTNGY